MGVGESGHHVSSVRKSKDKTFGVERSDKSHPTFFPTGDDPEYDHWKMYDAERQNVGPKQGSFAGADERLLDAC